ADAAIAFGKVARERIAALHHKVGNDPVELHAIVETRIGELFKVLDRLGRLSRVQLGDEGALGGLEGSQLWHRGSWLERSQFTSRGGAKTTTTLQRSAIGDQSSAGRA